MGFARVLSTVAFVVSAVVHLGLVQSAGSIIDTCLAFGLFDVSLEKCQAISARWMRTGQDEKDMLMLAYTAMRGECCQYIGMGTGSLYALFFLKKGTKQVAVVHLMHAIWACTVQVANSQNAGVLAPYLPAAAEYDPVSQKKLYPFLVLVGAQAVLYVAAFVVSCRTEPESAKPKGKGKKA